MRAPHRVVLVPAAAFASALAFGACGIAGDEAVVTLPPIRTTTTTVVPATTVDLTRYFYEVQPGDHLNSIADKFCVPYDELLEVNSEELPDPGLLQVGQMLEIPKGVKVIDCVPVSQTTSP